MQTRWLLPLLAFLAFSFTGCTRSHPSASTPNPNDDEVRAALRIPMQALEHGQPREAIIALLGQDPDAAAWKRTEKTMSGHASRTAQTDAETCARNLVALSDAIELYRADEANGYRMPEKLSSLVGQNGMTALPTCPAAHKDTYTAGYKPDFRNETFVLVCRGHQHAAAGLRANMPRYEPSFGVVLQNDPTVAWWPAPYKIEIDSIDRQGDHAVVTMKESSNDNRTVQLVLDKRGKSWIIDSDKLADAGSATLGQLLSTYRTALTTPPPVATVDRATCERNMQRVATALEGYSSDHAGRYPAQLQELVPHYLPELPACSGEHGDMIPHYRSSNNGFELSCAGQHPDVHVSTHPNGGMRTVGHVSTLR